VNTRPIWKSDRHREHSDHANDSANAAAELIFGPTSDNPARTAVEPEIELTSNVGGRRPVSLVWGEGDAVQHIAKRMNLRSADSVSRAGHPRDIIAPIRVSPIASV
jgi:hypothetical protein